MRLVRDDEEGTPVYTVRDLERTIIDMAQDVAATMSLAEGDQGPVTGEAVLALCDAVHSYNATIVTQGCPSAFPARSDSPA